jgi:hypothetical protein
MEAVEAIEATQFCGGANRRPALGWILAHLVSVLTALGLAIL